MTERVDDEMSCYRCFDMAMYSIYISIFSKSRKALPGSFEGAMATDLSRY